MTKTTIRNSTFFKRRVVESIEKDGLSIEDWGIKGGSIIQQWLRQFGKNYL